MLGRTGNLNDQITVQKTASLVTITVQPGTVFAKRYIKYLAKKFLKKHQLRDWLRVVANSKGGYELKYFNIEQQKEEDDE